MLCKQTMLEKQWLSEFSNWQNWNYISSLDKANVSASGQKCGSFWCNFFNTFFIFGTGYLFYAEKSHSSSEENGFCCMESSLYVQYQRWLTALCKYTQTRTCFVILQSSLMCITPLSVIRCALPGSASTVMGLIWLWGRKMKWKAKLSEVFLSKVETIPQPDSTPTSNIITMIEQCSFYRMSVAI